MANKTLFSPASKAPPALHLNEAGGAAYAFSAKHALAQYAVTGTFGRTYYATEGEQLDVVLSLLGQVDAAFIAKTAVYARERGRMKDMPALLLAYLTVADVRWLSLVFARVIDNGKMLRTFVQIVRSGVAGRKSFGTAPKRLIRTWFASRTPSELFRQAIGSSPSFKDVIKMVRPSPRSREGELDQEREALYGYLIGKEVAFERLPAEVRSYDAFKRHGGELPNVPFEMLTALGLSVEQWAELAKRMSFNQLRQGLNSLLRRGVFRDPAMVELVASRLRDPDGIRRSRTLPYQLLSAFTAAKSTMPNAITLALQDAMEIAIVSVPRVAGKVYVCPDVSGSMHSAVTGERKGATSNVRCLDVAALVAAAILRRNPRPK